MGDLTYKMTGKGGTTGAVTGNTRSWYPGQEIEAPEGEFRHLSDDAYEVRPKAGTSKKKDAPGAIKELGGGWYEVRGQKVQGKTAAEDLLNES